VRITFIGAGGVGGYFGGRLAAAGEDVTFLARGRHLEAMRREGLFLVGPEETIRVHPVRATDRTDEIGPVDLVVVAVKHWDLEEAARVARRLAGPATEVVSFLNGVEAPEVLAREVGRERVLGGVAYIVAWIESPGRIRHGASIRRLALGGLDGRRSQVAEVFARACARAGFEAALPAAIEVTLWEKFVLLSALSGVTAAARLPIGPLRRDPGTRDLIARAMQETAALARARGVPLPEDAADRQLAWCDRLPADSVSSMLTDLTRGNRLELPWLSGAVVRLGRESGVATPVHAFLSAILGPHAAGKA
jgi:2-dehydropantoate 2-reductase